MRNKFDMQLMALNQEMLKMGTMIEESISRSIGAFSKRDVDKANEIIDNDEAIDDQQKKIEGICFNLLIQQQPVARDLRVITAAMKMVTDMERIGDHAADICEMTILMQKNGKYDSLKDINKMATETVYMLNSSIEAYVDKDAKKARDVIAHDDVVDNLFMNAKSDIIKMIINNEEDGENIADLLMVAKYFERIGDHATNIAEWVLYSMGEEVK